MGPFYLILALLIQNSYTETIASSEDNKIESEEILNIKPECDNSTVKEHEPDSKDWMDLFISSPGTIFPTSSAALMAQATFSNKSPEEQLEEIKTMAEEITKSLQSEMAHLLSCAVSITNKDVTDNNLRRKRSIETPMDSTKLVMRLLKHIKCNNEYQNIAIEKMMTAQEIADKYGIEFNPDPEILSDLALAANEQAKEMTDILKDACDLKNITCQNNENDSYFDHEKADTIQNLVDCAEKKEPVQPLKFHDYSNTITPDNMSYKESSHENHDSFSHYNYYYNHPYETQIPAPQTYHYHSEPVSPRPNFYDYISYNPNQDYTPYCSMEPIFLSMDEPMYSEPELVGEEYEETVSSKIYIDHEEEPGVSSVNHVMTYTISEKSHYRTPQIDSLPQQMQYYFLLM